MWRITASPWHEEPLLSDAGEARPVRSGPRAGLPRIRTDVRGVAEAGVDVAPHLQENVMSGKINLP